VLARVHTLYSRILLAADDIDSRHGRISHTNTEKDHDELPRDSELLSESILREAADIDDRRGECGTSIAA